MIRFAFILAIGLVVSCSHKSKAIKNDLAQRIEKQEVRSLQEIQDDVQAMLAEHQELDEQAKQEVSVSVGQGLARLQELKDRESQVIQAVLAKLVMSPGNTNHAILAGLKSEIDAIYLAKSENVTQIINDIRIATARNLPTESFYRDLGLIIREIR
jgi:hypothetical protein